MTLLTAATVMMFLAPVVVCGATTATGGNYSCSSADDTCQPAGVTLAGRRGVTADNATCFRRPVVVALGTVWVVAGSTAAPASTDDQYQQTAEQRHCHRHAAHRHRHQSNICNSRRIISSINHEYRSTNIAWLLNFVTILHTSEKRRKIKEMTCMKMDMNSK